MSIVHSSFERLYLDIINSTDKGRRFLESDTIFYNHTLFLSEEPAIIENTYFHKLYHTSLTYRPVSDTVSLDGDQTEIQYHVVIRGDTGASEHLCFDLRCVPRSKLIYFLEAVVEPILKTADIQTLIGNNSQQTHRIVSFQNLDYVFSPGTDTKARRKILFYLERYVRTTFFFFSVSTDTKNRMTDFMAYCSVFLIPRIQSVCPRIQGWLEQQFRIRIEPSTLIHNGYTLRQYVRSVVHPEYDDGIRSLLASLTDSKKTTTALIQSIRSFAIQWITDGRTIKELEGSMIDWITRHRGEFKLDLSELFSQLAEADYQLVRGKKLIFYIEHFFVILLEALRKPQSDKTECTPTVNRDDHEENE